MINSLRERSECRPGRRHDNGVLAVARAWMMWSSSGTGDDARPFPKGQIGHAVELKLAHEVSRNTSCGRLLAAAAWAHRAICAYFIYGARGSIMQIGVHLPH